MSNFRRVKNLHVQKSILSRSKGDRYFAVLMECEQFGFDGGHDFRQIGFFFFFFFFFFCTCTTRH